MRIPFTKYQGTGNDFILIDNRDNFFPKNVEVIQKLTDRKFGIGSDGLMLIENHPDGDFKMIYFNADGSQSLCGNGSRCAVDFASSLGIIDKSTDFETTDGFHNAYFKDDKVYFELHNVSGIERIDETQFYINTGSPHHIKIVQDVESVDVVKEGAKIRHSEKYSPDGTNVNFIELKKNHIVVRTYERGVENETLSCGTGVTAAAIAASFLGFKSPVDIQTRGGSLQVTYDKISEGAFHNIYLAGPATKVFEGFIDI